MSNSWIDTFSANRIARHEQIDAHAAEAQEERKLITALAMRNIRRIAEFPARSAGQKRRNKKEKTK